MLKRAITLATALVWSAAAWSAAPGALTSLQAVHALDNVQAAKALPVSFEATVTYYRNDDVDLFVQDNGVAIYVFTTPGGNFLPGDRLRITGKTKDSFRPYIIPDQLTLLHHGAPPAPVPVNFEELVRAQRDCMKVKLRAVVRTANMVGNKASAYIYLEALMDGGFIDVAINSSDESALPSLLDAEVEVTGIVGAKFDQKIELTGIRIGVQSLDDIRILHPSRADSQSLPLTPMEEILGSYKVLDLSRRVRVRGTITYYQPGSNIVLQDGSKSLWVSTLTSQPLRVGDIAEVSGFPEVRFGYLGLAHAEIRDTEKWAPIQPISIGWQDIGYGGNAFNRVSIEGRVVRQVREAARDEYVLTAGGHLFSAIYRHPLPAVSPQPPPVKTIPEGSLVRVTGIGMFYSTDSFNGPIASDLLLQSLDDITVVARPSWVNVRALVTVVLFLLVALVAVSLRGLFLGRKVLRQTAAIAADHEATAALERQRSQILEDINASRPLGEILERIAQSVSLRLCGVPSWCEIAADATLHGNRPADTANLRIARMEIPARFGSPHGLFFAAFDPSAPSLPLQTEALTTGAKLATLAIETQRLYSDLRHRSDFDPLTDIYNRHSLDRLLEDLIAASSQSGAAFALVYIDLDEFKQVNDRYGHHVGDLYLQKLTQRIKHCLRSQDILARIGGDEFALLLPEVRSRAEAADIFQRVERSFYHPLSIEGFSLFASLSSGIALFPENGHSKDDLMRIADEAMYAAKHAKQMKRQASADITLSGA
jgi:diguanylate cyclase (GGDEF)-like protein